MFYTYLLLGKRGALSKIWIAAHWEKKLTKAHIFECNLDLAIQSIMAPKVVIALRTSGHLLLGVVRIYHRKAKYLLADCNEAILKMKITFRPGALDLAEDNKEASYNAITLPEEFYEFDTQLPDLNLIDVVDHFTLNQSRMEDITIREDYGRQFILDDGFGNYLDTFRQDSPKDDSFEVSTNSFLPEQSSVSLNGEERDRFNQDCFGDEGTTTSDFFDNSQIFIESTNPCAERNASKELLFPASPLEDEQQLEATLGDDATENLAAANNTTLLSNEERGFVLEPVDVSVALGDDAKEMPAENLPVANNTTLLSNDDDSFVLEPLDVSAVQMRTRSKRKRKLMVDNLKEIPSNCMREQLINISDTLTSFDIAPPTHSLMERNLTGGVQMLLTCPTQPIINTDLLLLFTQFKELDTSKHMHEEPAEPEPEIETLRKEQEEFDLQQLEMTRLADVSSSYTEEPSNVHDLTTYNLTTSNESQAVQEEMGDPLLYTSPRCLAADEIIAPTENVQDSGEHQWNKRTHEMLGDLRTLHQSGVSSFSLQKLCQNNKRKQVSGKFYSFLVLTKQLAIKMRQTVPYGDIIAIPGSRFHTL